jgi:C1A family cysteine protease
MNKKLTLILVVSISTLFVCTSLAFDENKEPPLMQAPQPKYDLMPEENFGLLPPPIDLTHIGKTKAEKTEELPSHYDLRSLEKVTLVKNQNPCGTCWAFATTGSLESRILVENSITYDLSEQCIVACNIDDTSCDSGGNIWISTNYLSKRGSHLESDYPYTCPDISCGDPVCICTPPNINNLTGWRLVCYEPDTNAIKNAVNNYGGVYCAMYAGFSGFSSYDGTGVLYYTGTNNCTHAVTIIGWDDDMEHAGGKGAWIAKNSWGTGWGDSGYFYIAYGSARIGSYASYKDIQTVVALICPRELLGNTRDAVRMRL